MNKFNNQLSEAELERLAVLIEECAEVQQIATKILRHGPRSYHPNDINRTPNIDLLERELGDLKFIVHFMYERGDVDKDNVAHHAADKRVRIAPYLHHNTIQ